VGTALRGSTGRATAAAATAASAAGAFAFTLILHHADDGEGDSGNDDRYHE